MSGDIIGVECGLCHEECFQTFERMAYVKIKCCKRCTGILDEEELERIEKGSLSGMSKSERLLIYKQKSRDWAMDWQGKHVIVTYGVSSQGMYSEPEAYCKIRGTAYYGSKNEDIGWGRIRVVLDEQEVQRLKFHDKRPIIDGYEWGMGSQLISHYHNNHHHLEQPLAFFVNWGDRKLMTLEEFDEQAELLAAKREEERQRLEREKEIERHLGEGI